MRLLTFLLADYANITDNGKLNVLGIFNNIQSSSFPARHSSLFLVLKFGIELGEYNQDRSLSIKLYDEDGNQLYEFSKDLKIPDSSGKIKPEINFLVQINDLIFPKPGRYQFSVFSEKDHKGEVSLDLIDLNTKKSGS